MFGFNWSAEWWSRSSFVWSRIEIRCLRCRNLNGSRLCSLRHCSLAEKWRHKRGDVTESRERRGGGVSEFRAASIVSLGVGKWSSACKSSAPIDNLPSPSSIIVVTTHSPTHCYQHSLADVITVSRGDYVTPISSVSSVSTCAEVCNDCFCFRLPCPASASLV